MQSRILIATLALAALLQAADAAAQTRSATGRQRSPAADRPDTAAAPALPAAVDAGPWSVGVCGLSLGGGDLFRAEVAGGVPAPWQAVDGQDFSSPRFTAVLERNLGFGATVRRELGRRLTLRADVAYVRLDVAAEALLGQTGAILLYDRISVLRGGLGLDVRLASARHYPYAGAGVQALRLDPQLATGLEQTVAGVHAHLGYSRDLGRRTRAQAEIRVSRTAFDLGGFRPPAAQGGDPDVSVSGPDHLGFLEFALCIVGNL